MDRYVGLDDHSSSCTVAVVGPNGKRLQTKVLETNAKVLTLSVWPRSCESVPRRRGFTRNRELLEHYLWPKHSTSNTTKFPYQIPGTADGRPTTQHVKLEIFNVLGQRVATLVDGPKASGDHAAHLSDLNRTPIIGLAQRLRL